MKKYLAVGLASMAITAVPFFSSISHAAGGAVIDELNITLYDSCTIDRSEGLGEYYSTVIPGSHSNNFATSVFSVSCNNPDVYYITAQFSDLTDESDHKIVYRASEPNDNASYWAVKAGQTIPSQTYVTSGDRILSVTAADEGESVSVRYSVGVSPDQPAGSYTGTATYTLVSGDN